MAQRQGGGIEAQKAHKGGVRKSSSPVGKKGNGSPAVNKRQSNKESAPPKKTTTMEKKKKKTGGGKMCAGGVRGGSKGEKSKGRVWMGIT